MNYNRLYKKLLKEHGPEELAYCFVFPVKLTKKQQKEAAEQLAAARKKNRETLIFINSQTNLQPDTLY